MGETKPFAAKKQFKGAFLVLEFLKDLWAFLKVRKKIWLLPIIIILALLGAIVVATQQSSLATFIYTIF